MFEIHENSGWEVLSYSKVRSFSPVDPHFFPEIFYLSHLVPFVFLSFIQNRSMSSSDFPAVSGISFQTISM